MHKEISGSADWCWYQATHPTEPYFFSENTPFTYDKYDGGVKCLFSVLTFKSSAEESAATSDWHQRDFFVPVPTKQVLSQTAAAWRAAAFASAGSSLSALSARNWQGRSESLVLLMGSRNGMVDRVLLGDVEIMGCVRWPRRGWKQRCSAKVRHWKWILKRHI